MGNAAAGVIADNDRIAGRRSRTSPRPATLSGSARPVVAGKFLLIDGEHFFVRGVTYGTFEPDSEGNDFHDRARVDQDFAQMAELGANAVRTYTVPPVWLLDTAWRHGLRVMVGVPWEQHITFLDQPGVADQIIARVRDGVASCAGHPAVLFYAVGNEIPAPVVRWLGRRRVEQFIERLYRASKQADPGGLVTYVSFPTTEYLVLPFLDVVCLNVYLESKDQLQAYLSRLHNLAGDRPLIMSELGLESRGNGEEKQATVLDWQIRTSFAAGCAGAFVFSWTDDWWRGGARVENWDFGLTNVDRRPKPAFESVRHAFSDVPFPPGLNWPRISVVVCTYNGSRTIRDCLDGLTVLDYPDFEVIVVDDGSTDTTAAIAGEYDFRLISTQNFGLSHARNAGLRAATGEIVAYTDDDARPDRHWLTYLAEAYMHSDYAGFGGPNISPAGDGEIAECVGNAPGGPVHVLLSDVEAEHIPGCNMSFRKSALEAVGGFDVQFRTAGDDVDVCWRMHERGFRIGFVPAAVVWHHNRNSVRTYWRQQTGYGKAEALLERKWPERYNSAGHVTWSGRLYASRLEQAWMRRRGRIYHGIWGSGLFQSLYEPPRGQLFSLPQTPEWYLGIMILLFLSILGLAWPPLLLAAPALLVAMGISIWQATLAALESEYPSAPRSPVVRARQRVITAFLHFIQPLARLIGRARLGLTPWRLRGGKGWSAPVRREDVVWTEEWEHPDHRLAFLEESIRGAGAIPRQGSYCDPWDLYVRTGVFGEVRMLVCIEEHGRGRQYVRVRSWPTYSRGGLLAILVFGLWGAGALIAGAIGVGLVLAGAAAFLVISFIRQSGLAAAVVQCALTEARDSWGPERQRRTD